MSYISQYRPDYILFLQLIRNLFTSYHLVLLPIRDSR
nr:MAG TPA: hypothetical protein [Caudoviricetes sp.]